jgi:hypothetical protein
MSLDFTAVDFETASSYRGSPCSVVAAQCGVDIASTTRPVMTPVAQR